MGRRLTKSNKNRSLSSTKSSQRQNDSLENSDDEYHVDSNEHDEDEDDEEDNIHTANNHAGFVSVKTELLSDDWEDIPYLRRLSDHAATIEDADTTLKTDFGTEVDTAVWNKMYEYQRDGVQWMYKMYRDGVGGILADEMGLGKTCQLCVHFGALARLNASDHFASSSSSMDITRSDHHNSSSQPKLKPREHASAAFLIVCPATVLQHWLKEMHSWAPHIRTVILHSMSATGGELTRLGNEKIQLVIRRVQRLQATRGLAVLVTYEGMRSMHAALCAIEWTAVCLDEGHRVRNPNAEVSKVCKLVPCYHRLILSGTPIQNTLTELWSLFDFIYPGRLGTLPVFQAEFCEPIRTGGYAGANALKVEIATKTAGILQRIVKPYLLRRRKDQVTLPVPLPEKTEHVIFCTLTAKQREMYMTVLGSQEVEAIIQNRMMPFRALSTLRKICNHPCLLTDDDRTLLSGDRYSSTGRLLRQPPTKGSHGFGYNRSSSAAKNKAPITDDDDDSEDEIVNPNVNWADSGKLNVLSKILPMWQQQGHKVLLFSQTRSMLNVLEILFRKHFNFRYLRLDGSTAVSKRSSIIERFNSDPSIFLILLTTRTGGVGISLTGADRVLLLDPDWNPQVDLQSRERAWRLGQQRPVTVYRLITRGAIEEKIYERQIYKIMLSNRILLDSKQKAFVSKSAIKELFTLTDYATPSILNTGNHGSENNQGNNALTKRHQKNSDYDYEEEYLSFPAAGVVDIHSHTISQSTSSNTAISPSANVNASFPASFATSTSSSSTSSSSSAVVQGSDNIAMMGEAMVSDNNDDFQVTATDMFSSSSILPFETADTDVLKGGECCDDSSGSKDRGHGIRGANKKTEKEAQEANIAYQRLMRRLRMHNAPLIPQPLPQLNLQGGSNDNVASDEHKNSLNSSRNSMIESSSSHSANVRATSVPVASHVGSLDDNSLIVIRKVRIRDDKESEITKQKESASSMQNNKNSVNNNSVTEVPNAKTLSDDKELLQLLFSDKVISSVYDHAYLESGGQMRPKSSASSLEQLASKKVESALMTLQKSAPAYIPSSNTMQPTASSSSSSSLLANIRKRKQEETIIAPVESVDGAMNVNIPDRKIRAPEVVLRRGVYAEQSRAPTAMAVRMTIDRVKESMNVATNGRNIQVNDNKPEENIDEGESSSNGSGLHATITRRIRNLFQQRGPQLSTDFLLRQFADLGDQYAVVFRTCLKQCAHKVGSGTWEETKAR